MSSKHIRADINIAFPQAEIAVMGADGAVNIIYKNQLAKAENPAKLKEELTEEYKKNFSNPYKAAELGYIDEVIDPAYLRQKLVNYLVMLENKKDTNPPKKHGNIPL